MSMTATREEPNLFGQLIQANELGVRLPLRRLGGDKGRARGHHGDVEPRI